MLHAQDVIGKPPALVLRTVVAARVGPCREMFARWINKAKDADLRHRATEVSRAFWAERAPKSVAESVALFRQSVTKSVTAHSRTERLGVEPSTRAKT